MRFIFTMGRVTIINITLFEVAEKIEDPDVVVVHHFNDDEDKPEPGDLFGGKE